jgi:DNA-binding MarR family transcriptional regulator
VSTGAEPAFGADHDCIPPDAIDRLIADWSRVRPDLDFAPLGIVARIGRARTHIAAALEAVFAQHGLSDPSFAVLVTLVRLDRPDGVPQRTLMDELGLTAGTISVRMDRLEEQGLVERRPDAADRRNTLIAITERGRALFERVAPAHLENERRLLVALDVNEQAMLATLLRKLLVEYEGAGRGDGPGGRLGLVLAPAHVAIAMRAAVGLAPAAGLLVREVADDGPAHGVLQRGDVLDQAGGRALTSVAALRAALAAAAPHGPLTVRVVRGEDVVTAQIPLQERDSGAPEAEARRVRRGPRDLHIV